MTDQQLATTWDADHRLAARVAFFAGVAMTVGAALWFTVGMEVGRQSVQGERPGAFAVTLVGGVLMLTDVALLVFVVGLAHAVSAARSFGLTVTTAVATLATTVAAALHLVWGYVAAAPEVELVSGEMVPFVSWLALNIYLLPLFGMLVGATLVALSLPLRGSRFRTARRLGTASLVVGGLLCVLGPFTGMTPEQPAIVAVAAILVACVGIAGLVLVALVWLGRLLWQARDSRRSGAHQL